MSLPTWHDVPNGADGLHGETRVITLADHGRRNALTLDTVDMLHDILERTAADPAVAAVILTHEGSTFCAGTDLQELVAAQEHGRSRELLARIISLVRRIETYPLATFAATEGAAVGGGFEILLACDLRVMGEESWVSLPELRFGAIPGAGGVQRLTRFVGRSKTLEFVLLGNRYAAQDCASLGLCTAVPRGGALDTALAMAAAIAKGSREAVAAAKSLILRSEVNDLQHSDREALDGMLGCLAGDEGQEGLRALQERRTPEFHLYRAEAK